MRLHRLRVQAFGPFAEVEDVDFDALSDAGLFLLHGPTGAGKTSVLDALCFALYGQVPGQRHTTRLRSDHAAPDAEPRVVCELSVGARRLEVVRSPSWERPKRRGTGTTTEQARVAVRERAADGTWTTVTTRLDEAGLLLDDLLGMRLDVFTKLVVLPQGDFAAFLRADAKDRQHMLEHLFGTDRFTAVQDWMRERQALERHEVEAALDATHRLLARAGQAAGPVVGARDVPSPHEEDPIETVEALLRDVTRTWEDAEAAQGAAAKGRGVAEAAYECAQALARRRADHARLSGELARLLEAASVVEAARARLLAHERAAGLAPMAAPLRSAAAAHADAERTLAALAGPDAAASPHDLADDAVRALGDAARADLGALSAVLTAAKDRAEHAADVARRSTALAELLTARRHAQTGLDAASAELSAVREALVGARGVAATLPACAAARDAAAAALGAAQERDGLTAAEATATRHRDEARRAFDDARQHWLDLREARLAGIAAELAAALGDGEPCLVCGSTDHPDPAAAAAGQERVTAAREKDAHTRTATAESALAQAQAALVQAATSRADAAGRADGRSVQDAAMALATARQRLAAAQEADADALALAGREAELLAALTRAGADLDAASGEIEQVRQALAVALERERSAADAVRDGCGDDADPAARRDRLTAVLHRAEALLAARSTARQAAQRYAELRRAATDAALAAGFEDVDRAVEAVLDADEHAALTAGVEAWQSERAATTAALVQDSLVEALAQPAPDLARAGAELELARADDEAATRRAALGESAVTVLRELRGELRTHVRRSGPALRRWRLVKDLADCLNGAGGENTRRMALSAYVLAARLEQVAEAASLRLSQMSGGRYTLVHSDALARGGRRSGLSLHVVDEWTGLERETGSLSGGETFYTSLALALGLADVVSAEAGGTAIETLFVDEGFGALDDDTLEEVMDALDALRSGGRAVGLVSHVADLRRRIPARLEVVKTRTGSTLTLSVAS